MKCTGAKILLESLKKMGVECIFGYPGGSILDIYEELYKSKGKLKHYLMASEQGATFAADGYARASGKVGVVLATSGPGATNLVTGIANSFLDSTPLVVITGNVPTNKLGQDSFQEVDIYGITMPVVKYSYLCKNVADLEQMIVDSFEIAKSGRPGPVLIDIPKDILSNKCEYYGNLTPKIHKKVLNYVPDYQKAIGLINQSKKPLIYCGGGVVGGNASEMVLELAKTLNAPIAYTMMGKSAVPSTSEYNVGMTGMHGNLLANTLKNDADLIIALGVRFSDRATNQRDFCSQKIIHVDIDLVELNKNVECDCLIKSEINEFLSNILPEVKRKNDNAWWKDGCYQNNQTYQTQGFTPCSVIKMLAENLYADDIIATDVGQHQLWAAQCYPTSKPRTFLTSCGLGAMGYGLGACIGGTIATGMRGVLITGDGSFAMNCNELAVAVENNLPIMIVILNNGALGMVKQWQSEFYKKHFCGVNISGRVNFEMLAKAYGVKQSFTIDSLDKLSELLSKHKNFKQPILLNCLIDSNEQVLPFVHPDKM